MGLVVTEARGKLGGHVFSKGRGGATLRTRKTPANAQLDYMSYNRVAFSNFSKEWRTLTAAQRAAWNGAVSAWSGTNVFGDVKNPSGINLFMRLNLVLNQSGGSVLLLPPLPVAIPAIKALTVTADVSSDFIIFSMVNTIVSVNQVYMIEVSQPISPGISNYKGLFRFIAQAGSTDFPSFTLNNGDGAWFPTLIAGQKLVARIRIVDTTTGQTGEYISATCIITA